MSDNAQANQSPGRRLSQGDYAGLETWLANAMDASRVEIARAERLSGGAVQENWRIDALVDGGTYSGAQRWVLRTDAVASLAVSLDRTAEFGVLTVAHQAGVKVAQPIARCEDASVIGAQFILQAFMQGEAQARRLVRDAKVDDWGPAVAKELGQELARVHKVRAGHNDLAFLPQPMLSAAKSEVARLRAGLDGTAEPRPALEYILTWLHENDPGSERLTLVHGDYRTGNYLVLDGHLSSILDWEFAHWGDPHEDIGWFTAKCWRFGRHDREAGGIAPLNAFLDGYRAISGDVIDVSQLPFWQVLATAKWAAIAVLQGDRYRTGGENSLELALTGLMPSELELEALGDIAAIEDALQNS